MRIDRVFPQPVKAVTDLSHLWHPSATLRASQKPCHFEAARFPQHARSKLEVTAMDYKLKRISSAGIAEAVAKAELYRSLNEPEEAESICRDILAVDPGHQLARRMLGLAITDQFIGAASDRYIEVQSIFQGLRDPYERLYYTGLRSEERR